MKQYLDLVQDIFATGNARGDRTGTGTISKFGPQMRFNLKEGFPIVTTKFVPIRLVAVELLWFLTGDTNNNTLAKQNCHIWDEWALNDMQPLTVSYRRHLLEEELKKQFGEEAPVLPHFGTNEELGSWFGQYLKDNSRISLPVIPTHIQGPRDGELGPVYGAQWRSWPGKIMQKRDTGEDSISEVEMGYKEWSTGAAMGMPDAGTHVFQQPIDQIKDLIEGLRTKPFSRRHIVSAWNPANLPIEGVSHEENVKAGRQALPPCHCLFQFYVSERPIAEVREEAGQELWAKFDEWKAGLVSGKDYEGSILNVDYSNLCLKWLEEHGVKTKQLSCQLYQRSADMFLGVPFNISSYSLLLAMVAQCVGMVPFEFIHTFGDSHIYNNHFDQFDEQLGRRPKALPKLWLNPEVTDIFKFTMADIKLEGYEHHPAIKGKVAV